MARIDNQQWYGTKSTTFREVKLSILGKPSETLTLPLQVTTKVIEVKQMLGGKLGMNWEDLKFVQKGVGGKTRELRDKEEVRTNTIVKGVKQFERERTQWAHPMAIVGAGHSGLRTALGYIKYKIPNFLIFDRNERVGGAAWAVDANNTSKLQTEKAVYYLDYDPSFKENIDHLPTQPSALQLLEHFEQVSDDYGVTPHIRLCSDVTSIDVVKDDRDPSGFTQTYHLTVEHLAPSPNKGDEYIVECSSVAYFPGGLISPKQVDFKGEDVFEGQITYGTNNAFNYSLAKDKNVGIIGMGAFATENVRTCVESYVNKVFIICRRRNMCMPRMVSWFTNQALFPVPGATCLEMMQGVHELANEGGANLGDPWDYYCVVANSKRTTATLRQDSRFGITDVFYLACHYGKCEVVVGATKRFKRDGIQLESGDFVPCDHVIKVLGWLGDMTTDKVLGIKNMEGWHVNGDFRRMCWAEQPGIDAGKFGGTSFSPGAITFADLQSHILNYPMDSFMILGTGLLPKKKFNPDVVRPTYVWDPRSAGTIMMMYNNIPGVAELGAPYAQFNRDQMLKYHPPDIFVPECEAEWIGYCKIFKEQGDDRPFPPYPYTKEYVKKLMADQDREGQEEQDKQNARQMGG
jgi:hypothetical protein